MQSSEFSVIGSSAVLMAAEKTIATVIAAVSVRPKIYDLLVSFISTPADVQTQFAFSRITDESAGTSTGVTPEPTTDPDGRAADATAGSNYTVEPTYGNDILDFGLHQRASWRWIAAPNSELVIPALANRAMGLHSIISDATPTAKATILFAE